MENGNPVYLGVPFLFRLFERRGEGRGGGGYYYDLYIIFLILTFLLYFILLPSTFARFPPLGVACIYSQHLHLSMLIVFLRLLPFPHFA